MCGSTFNKIGVYRFYMIILSASQGIFNFYVAYCAKILSVFCPCQPLSLFHRKSSEVSQLQLLLVNLCSREENQVLHQGLLLTLR